MPSPRVLIVWGDETERALVRAQLIEEGYDAVGASSLSSALLIPAQEKGRGPVTLIVVDEGVAQEPSPGLLADLLSRHPLAAVLLLAHGAGTVPVGPWERVLRRPLSIGDLVRAVKERAPLTPR